MFRNPYVPEEMVETIESRMHDFYDYEPLKVLSLLESYTGYYVCPDIYEAFNEALNEIKARHAKKFNKSAAFAIPRIKTLVLDMRSKIRLDNPFENLTFDLS